LLATDECGFSKGLKEIGELAFCRCTSLHAIVIPPLVKKIPWLAFKYCLELMNVDLPKGLEEIGQGAFWGCTSLRAIVIPQSVKAIVIKAFKNCLQLTRVQFCEEIKAFVSGESMRDWRNHGVHEKSLSTYCFLVRCSIPQRLCLV
jgi:hypothetical protein